MRTDVQDTPDSALGVPGGLAASSLLQADPFQPTAHGVWVSLLPPVLYLPTATQNPPDTHDTPASWLNQVEIGGATAVTCVQLEPPQELASAST
jgi:hypothetical protein